MGGLLARTWATDQWEHHLGEKQKQKQKVLLPSQCPSTACNFSVGCRNVWVLFSCFMKDEGPESEDLVQVHLQGFQACNGCASSRRQLGGTFSQCLCLIFILLPICDILWALEADDTDVPLRAERSYSPRFGQLRVSVFTATCWKEKYLWWWLSTANVIVTSGGVPSSSALLQSSNTMFSLKDVTWKSRIFPLMSVFCFKLFSISEDKQLDPPFINVSPTQEGKERKDGELVLLERKAIATWESKTIKFNKQKKTMMWGWARPVYFL